MNACNWDAKPGWEQIVCGFEFGGVELDCLDHQAQERCLGRRLSCDVRGCVTISPELNEGKRGR